ncbi:MAG: histidine phosphatase family protein [Lachnospiraceae bacterium]|nr:histidine phosphatase family protein [Lachnospiraceae bacterium]
MELYIIRHGETDWNKEKRLQGQSDTELNAYGVELARITAEALEDVQFDYMFASPLRRACHTAEIIRGKRKLDIVTDDRLKEIGFGVNEGVPADQISEDFHYFFDAPEKYRPARGGETYEQLCARSRHFIDNVIVPLSEREPECRAVIVAHGALNKSIMVYLKGLEIRNMWDGVFQKNCCVNIFEINGTDFKLLQEAKVYY